MNTIKEIDEYRLGLYKIKFAAAAFSERFMREWFNGNKDDENWMRGSVGIKSFEEHELKPGLL